MIRNYYLDEGALAVAIYNKKFLKNLTLKMLAFWKFTKKWNEWFFDSYCNLKPLWLVIGEVVLARTSLTLHPPSPPTVL